MNNLSTVSDIEKHSAAHVLALAVSRVYPMVKIGIGPVTKSGFFYDFDIPGEIPQKHIEKIEKEVIKIIKEDLPFRQIIISRQEAINLMLQKGQIYKSELINSIPDEEISFFKTGEEFIDLCRGPHVNSTGDLGPIKISGVEEVYWNGDPSRPKLKRISGMVFRNQDEVSVFERIEGEKLSRDFFRFAGQKGYGFNYNNTFQLSEKGYQFVQNLYKLTHSELDIEKYSIYQPNILSKDIDEVGKIIDKSVFEKQPSFKNLPITVISKFVSSQTPLKDRVVDGEVIYIKRYSRQNDTIFGVNILEKFTKIFKETNLEFFADLKFNNLEDGMFKQISATLQRNLISHNKIQSKNSSIIEIELKTTDDLGRDWIFAKANVSVDAFSQSVTISSVATQISYLEIVIFPVNIFAFYLENHKEQFPSLLNPTQFVVIPVRKEFESNAEDIQRRIRKFEIISEVAYGNKSFKAKIRQFEKKNTPVLLIVGQKEVENESVSVRINNRDEGLVRVDNLRSYLEGNFFNK